MSNKLLWVGLGASCALLTALPAFGDTLRGRCTAVGDDAHITVQVGNRTEQVRLIGVDASVPSECEARGVSYVRSLVLGKQVKLVTDHQAKDGNMRLAYVFMTDGTFVNERVIANGYARMGSLGANTAHAGELVAAQNLARSHHLCAWVGAGKSPTVAGHPARNWSLPGARRSPPPLGGGGGGGRPRLPTPPSPRWQNPPLPPHWWGPKSADPPPKGTP